MAELIGIIIASALFAVLPGYLVGAEYGFVLGLCVFLLGLVLLELFQLLRQIRDLLKVIVERGS